MDNLQLVPVTITEITELQAISRQTFFDTFSAMNALEDMQHYLEVNLSLAQLSEELTNPFTRFYFATHEQEILGYLKLNEGQAQTEKRDIPSMEIERIYVLKDFQNKGVGQYMLDKSIKITRDKNLKKIWLGVWEHNVSAIRFYKRNHFEFFGKHSFMLGSDEQTDLLMERHLDQ